MLKMLLSIRTHLNNETMGLGTKAMDHFDNSALDCGWDRVGTINPSEPQITNKVVAAHYNLTLLNGLENISDLLVFEKITKLYWDFFFKCLGTPWLNFNRTVLMKEAFNSNTFHELNC